MKPASATNAVLLIDGAAPEPSADRAPTPRRVGRPRLDEAGQLDDHLVAVARRSFIDRGFNATTIERIAVECGTTRRSVMHRFADKDALLLEVAERDMSRDVRCIITNVSDEDEPLGILRSLCRNLLTFSTDTEKVALFRTCLGEVGRLPHLTERLIHHNNALEAGIERIVLEVQQRGRFQNYSAVAVATSAIGMMLSNPINRAMMGDPQFRDPHRIDLYFSQMWAIFLLMA
ncbi:Putative transcriptional regulator, TetR family [Novosphingobium sp. Rr 2-17]|uniref:TetR/AcrR family transcriptional regulator n=1 Tax=Novosphingobium sp. Rr 2-17 TaxID=555793 RepID=UPI0002698C13|nr:TetR/AcrR family transcriptional regulator [Novosphingobium sp. Rr 2-17]EIZ77609.1 Putative transcriptional regulator, TetR family [Novosphingobium sp. Rr 2-17]